MLRGWRAPGTPSGLVIPACGSCRYPADMGVGSCGTGGTPPCPADGGAWSVRIAGGTRPLADTRRAPEMARAPETARVLLVLRAIWPPWMAELASNEAALAGIVAGNCCGGEPSLASCGRGGEAWGGGSQRRATCGRGGGPKPVARGKPA